MTDGNARWARIAKLFDATLALGPAARDQLLAQEATTDPAAVSEVRLLLAAHERAGTFLETPAWQAHADLLASDIEPIAELSGRRIGPYDVREELGRGGMGVVYAAQDVRLGRMVALKALTAARVNDGTARERLAREARAAATLTHPHVATVYALEEIDGELFIASELVRGSTLRRELGAGALAPDVLVSTLTQIASALEAAHERGIVHRDLKPENVLRGADGRVKVVDFGIASSVTSASGFAAALTLTGAALGTPGYMPPEQLRGAPADPRADIFAFGVMAYELATGVHPFGGSDPASLVERLVSDDPPLSRAIAPPALDAAIRRCLRGRPVDRFASGRELLEALAAIDNDGDSPAPLAASLWWWQFHQVAIASVTIAAVVHLGIHHDWIERWGSTAFLASLVLATISTTLRLHMWFVSLVHPSTLRAVRARELRFVAASEALFLLTLASCAIVLAGRHAGIAAHLLVTALLLLLSLLVIEPATTRVSLV
ncbi:MAG: serine/threonine-protein kinase [Vicinamibacterales bacterium]